MRVSSEPSVARFKAHILKDFLIISGDVSLHASRIHFMTVRRGGACRFPAGVSWSIPSSPSHWSYFSVAFALKGLFQLTSGAWMCFVYPPGTIETLIFLAWSEDFMESSILHSYEAHTTWRRRNENIPRSLLI